MLEIGAAQFADLGDERRALIARACFMSLSASAPAWIDARGVSAAQQRIDQLLHCALSHGLVEEQAVQAFVVIAAGLDVPLPLHPDLDSALGDGRKSESARVQMFETLFRHDALGLQVLEPEAAEPTAAPFRDVG